MQAVAKWSFRTGCVLAVTWVIAVAVCLLVGSLDGVIWSMPLAPVAGGLMLLALLISAFSE